MLLSEWRVFCWFKGKSKCITGYCRNEEIVMPAEQTGLVRENYLWKMLLRRGATHDGHFHYVNDAAYDVQIFNIVWGASLSALSFMFDKSTETGYQRTLAGKL